MENWNKLDIIGKEVKSLHVSEEDIDILTKDGSSYRIYHQQDCCEDVLVKSVEGLLNMVHSKILDYTEDFSENELNEYGDSSTLTTYRFICDDGICIIEWLGVSNGYYSEVPIFKKIK